MRTGRVSAATAVALCAGVTGTVIGCGNDVELDDVATAAGSCALAEAGGGWSDQAFTEQATAFHVELDATPSANGIDAVIGLSDGPPTGFASLAAIVRFNPAGTIDVRSGSTYRADVVVPYTGGTTYHVELDVDLPRHTYSVGVIDGGTFRWIATNYPFRTEQAGAPRLGHAASFVDSAAGELEVCGLTLSPGGSDCAFATAGSGFVNTATATADHVMTVELMATPSRANTDAVIGLASGAADGFSDLAAAVRFAPGGWIDARRGGNYVRDQNVPYQPGTWYRFRFVVDLSAHRYSVLVIGGGGFEPIQLARDYEFRTEQAGVAQLNDLASIVDTDAGAMTVCGAATRVSVDHAYIRVGEHVAAPAEGTDVIVDDGTLLSRLDAGGHVLDQAVSGGQIAFDPNLDRVYVARAAGGVLTVEARQVDLIPVWSVDRPVDANLVVGGIGVDGGSLIAVALVDPAVFPPQPRMIVSLAASGGERWSMPVTASAVGFTPTGVVLGRSGANFVAIDQLDAGGVPAWSTVFSETVAGVSVITGDANGRVVFGGHYAAPVDFGGGALAYIPPQGESSVDTNTYAVALSSTGAHVFSRRVGFSTLTGVAATPSRIVVSGEVRTQLYYGYLQILDGSGAPESLQYESMLAFNARTGGVAVAANGRIYWSYRAQWPTNLGQWPYLVAIDR